MTTQVKVLINCEEYFIKTGKIQGNSCRVGIPVKYVDKEVILIPIIREYVIRKLKDETFNIIIETDDMIVKKARLKNGTGEVYVPKEYMGCELLITLAPTF